MSSDESETDSIFHYNFIPSKGENNNKVDEPKYLLDFNYFQSDK